jgi:hypothetical protein
MIWINQLRCSSARPRFAAQVVRAAYVNVAILLAVQDGHSIP